MRKKFTFLTAALALLAFLAIPMGMWGQSTKTEGFESASTSTTYNSTFTVNESQSDCGIGWSIYYGAVSTTGPIAGTKSAQMRWYKNSSTNYPYLKSTTAVDNLTNVAFKAKVGNTAVKMDVSYSTDGTNWTALATAVTFSNTNATDFSYSIPTGGKYIKIGVSSSSTTTSSNYLSLLVDNVVFTYSGNVNTYTVTYHANVTGVSDIEVEYNEGDDVIVAANTFTNPGYAFTEWNTEADGTGDSYAPGDEIEDIDDDIDLYAQWEVSTSTTGMIRFGSSTGHVKINAASVTGDDDINNEWTITTVGTTSFTQASTYSQVGSGNSPATSITFTTTLPEEVNVTAMEAKFGGFSNTAGTITMKVGGQTIGTGSLNATNDVVVNSSSTATGDVLTVTVTNIAKGVKCYYISYTYEEATPDPAVATTTTINVPSGFNTDIHNGTSAGTLTATVAAGGTAISGATVIWESSNTSVATIAANGDVTLVAVGTTTITASYAGVEDQYRPSSDTYELTVIDSYAPGTVNNPYTVAQAHAAIDANTGINGVYATGIVSAIPSAWNTQYNNITFNFVDNTGDTEFLQAYRCVSSSTADASQVQVGDIVVVFGNLKKYSSTYEFDAACQLVSLTHPAVAVEAPTFSPVAGTYAEAQTVTISCATEGADIYYTLDGSDPTMESTMYENPITVSQTTTIKAVAYDGNDTPSNIATATYHINSQANPYTVAQALAFNEYPANGIYVHGIVSTAPTSLSNGTLTYYISDDGTTTTQLEVYKGKDLENANFTAVDDIQVGDIVTVYGNVVIYGTTNPIKEFAQGNYLVSFERPTQQYTLTVTPSANVEIYTFVGDDPTQEGQAGAYTTQVSDGTTVGISVSADEGYILSLIVDGTDVTLQLDETGWYEFTMPAHDVTVTATASLAPVVTSNTYTLATSIESGKQYIIVGQADGDYYAMGNDKGNNRYAYGITLNGTTATANIANTGVHEFTISTITEGYYSIMDATTSGGYLYAAGSGSGKNYLKTESTLDENDNGKWAITFATDGTVAVIAQGTNTNNQMRFNNSSILFSCYSSGQHPVYLYVKDETPTPVTIPLSINAWTTVDGIPGNWYLITSPLKDPIDDPNDVTNMISDTPTNYDLYRFDQAAGFEWINYKDQNFEVNPNFGSLEAGTGYLYANANTVQLQFTGTAYSGTGEFPLAYSESNPDVNMRGWNLVGNPFTVEASVDHTYYRMNENRTDIMVGTGNVAAMEGVFVRASSTNTNQNVKFTRSAKATNSVEQTVIDLSRNNAVIDRAIISFGEDEPLPKIQLNQNNTKIYFMMENGAYAVVIGSYQAELPLNFKAATAGTYTLSFTNQNAEFDVLTLIDNQTNTQVDMLANPSYSFSAQTTDDVERFTVVYERAASYLTIGTGDLYSASGNNSTDSTKDGMGSPVGNTYYTASTAQFIYTASEMEGAKTIKSLAFYHNNQGPFIGTVKIYLDHTSASAVHTGSPATSGTLVYEGTNINIGSTSAGWQTFTLDTPFQYNGTDNLLVVVCRTKATSGNPNYHSDQGWKYTSYSQHYYYMQRSGNSNDTYGNIATTGNYARGFKRPNIKIGYTAPVINHFYLDIDGWTTNRNNYYLIASPIGQVAPTAVDNMLSNTYDLFYFDQDGDEVGYEWITYKPGNGATDPEFNLVPGKGYLYANSGVAGNDPNVVTLTFTGWGYTGSGQVDLIYSEANSDPNMWGWNLVGNPFGVEAYIDRPFYRMNEDGSELKSESETGSIGVMEGVFVHATQNETMTFTTTSNSKGSMVALNLSKDRKVIDRAIVRFGEGKQLPKLQLDKNSTKLYISQDNKDYALVSAEEQGEMPVSFKAEDNGTYNLNFSSENVEFAYLHLIDNMTGTDVDLLQTPSYSFEAKTTDYESRFKLVFATGDNSKEDNFAFFSNGSFVINNEGNATLQVIDVTGRIIKCESINGCANVNMNAAPGVYMLRLINGDNVKVQKVVVR